MYPNLRAEMARLGITSGELAKAIGISQSTFSLKYTGKIKWFFWEVCAIKKALGATMPLEQLFKEQR